MLTALYCVTMFHQLFQGRACTNTILVKTLKLQSSVVTVNIRQGFFFAILGRGPRAFQIGKISAVNHYFGKFSKQTRTAFLVSLKTKLAITHTIAIKLRENRMQF